MSRSPPLKPFLLGLWCCGCTSAPVHYYTLTSPPPASADLVSAACCRVKVARVLVPVALDRLELVIRSGDGQVVVLGNELWLAPLHDEIRNALSDDITAKLSKAATTQDNRVVTNVFVAITRFESVPGQYAFVTADWRFQRSAQSAPTLPTLATLHNCETTARVPVGNGVPALVLGYQRALGEIADQIVAALRDGAQSAIPGCTAD